jgi:hypothetical protein
MFIIISFPSQTICTVGHIPCFLRSLSGGNTSMPLFLVWKGQSWNACKLSVWSLRFICVLRRFLITEVTVHRRGREDVRKCTHNITIPSHSLALNYLENRKVSGNSLLNIDCTLNIAVHRCATILHRFLSFELFEMLAERMQSIRYY